MPCISTSWRTAPLPLTCLPGAGQTTSPSRPGGAAICGCVSPSSPSPAGAGRATAPSKLGRKGFFSSLAAWAAKPCECRQLSPCPSSAQDLGQERAQPWRTPIKGTGEVERRRHAGLCWVATAVTIKKLYETKQNKTKKQTPQKN